MCVAVNDMGWRVTAECDGSVVFVLCLIHFAAAARLFTPHATAYAIASLMLLLLL